MWEGLVRERGGVPVASVAASDSVELDGMRFVVVECGDDGILPAVAALGPAQAVAHLALSDAGAAPGPANRLLESLRASGLDAYLLKSGRVGGKDTDRSIEIRPDHAAAVLDAIVEGSIEWETDPDFGYRTATDVPGIEGRDRFLLVPRFLYARTERVYEYAALVPKLKRERVELLSALPGLDSAIVDAVR